MKPSIVKPFLFHFPIKLIDHNKLKVDTIITCKYLFYKNSKQKNTKLLTYTKV